MTDYSDFTEAIVDYRFIFNYASYYIRGLIELFGLDKVRFAAIDNITVDSRAEHRHGVAIELRKYSGQRYRIFIDFSDLKLINDKYYDWCDKYAVINCDEEKLSTRSKLLVIGPGFGVNLFNPVKTLTTGISNILRKQQPNNIGIKEILMEYAYTFIRRKPLEDYLKIVEPDDKYIFAISTLWYDKLTYSTTNNYRGVFMETCQKIYPYFEGGFFYIPKIAEQEFPQYREYLDRYSSLIYHRRISMAEYLRKTHRSSIVFNTPSVGGCHGWKLGEYLAMGKTIISTPLTNPMPGNFENGIHYIECPSVDALPDIIERLRNDKELRQKLAVNARKYFMDYLHPRRVIERIIKAIPTR